VATAELPQILATVAAGGELTAPQLRCLLCLDDPAEIQALIAAAYAVKTAQVGRKVFYRGIVEFSNICVRDCLYCGIRRSNRSVARYQLEEAEILAGARFAHANRYGSIVLQAGERQDAQFVDFIERVIARIKAETGGELGITLSLGEQTRETYARWRAAGAHRYLLRIETANPALYARLHPEDQRFAPRKACLGLLKELGYQVGTGVMIRLPYQTYDDLVADIRFFQAMDVDMIGMGPYLPSSGTPLAALGEEAYPIREDAYRLAIKMIAVVRIHLRDVNIAATTALQALKPFGREMGLKAGANIIMPNVTDALYRPAYQLYDGKPCTDENAEDCVTCLESRILEIDEEIGYGEWGDSPHARRDGGGAAPPA
jgi:biotin synthase